MNISKTLQSGAQLEITLSPFATSKALYQAALEELKGLHLDPSAEVDVNLWKDLFCTAMSSKKIELCLNECMKKCLYNGMKIDKDTFEPIEARGDYGEVCFEIAKENILPFAKSLSARFSAILGTLKKGPA